MSTFVPNEPTGPESLSDTLGKLFAINAWAKKAERLKLEETWSAAIGPEFGSDTRVLKVARGVFEVEVRNPILLQELASFHRKRLLDILQKKLPAKTIKELRFRSGVW